jgi:hypothetical protein
LEIFGDSNPVATLGLRLGAHDRDAQTDAHASLEVIERGSVFGLGDRWRAEVRRVAEPRAVIQVAVLEDGLKPLAVRPRSPPRDRLPANVDTISIREELIKSRNSSHDRRP